MKIFDRIIDKIGTITLKMIPRQKKERKQSVLTDVMENPEKYILVASIEDDDIVITITKKEFIKEGL